MQIPVSELMTRDLLVVHPADKLKRVKEIFDGNNIHHIPVVDKRGRIMGLIAKGDFLKVNHLLCLFDAERYAEYNDMLHRDLSVEEIMTTKLVTLNPDDELSIAADIFRENLFHALPVVDRGQLIGLLTTHDLLNYCCRESAGLAH